MNVTLKGIELANHLARELTDLEFEMLVRERIKQLFITAHNLVPNLSESYNSCTFHMSWTDNASWSVRIGENYNKAADIEGQVLSNCMHDVRQVYNMKHRNKLSLLLPAPEPESTVEDDDIIEDKKW